MSAAKSKLDYLKKYSDSSSGKKKKESSSTQRQSRGLKVIDAEDDANTYHSKSTSNIDEAWERLDSDDKPVVVEQSAADLEPKRISKFSEWTTSEQSVQGLGSPNRRSEQSGSARTRHDSDSDGPPRRRSEQSGSAPAARTRHDSDSNIPPVKAVSDMHEAKPSASARSKMEFTASGHAAGLQSGGTFGVKERELKRKRDLELASGDPALSGELEETVYRDKRGRKLDMLNEMMRQQALREGKAVKIAAVQMEWGKAAAQKREVEELAKEMQDIAQVS